MIADDENFASRWSRRKIEARETTEKPAEPKPTSEPAPAAPAVSNAGSVAAPPAPSELPPLESLKGLASEYTEFLKPGVDENLRRSALKKLFADPHFENFERFEAYCEELLQRRAPEILVHSGLQELGVFGSEALERFERRQLARGGRARRRCSGVRGSSRDCRFG